MASFIKPSDPNGYPGVVGIESAAGAVRAMCQGINSIKSLSAMLLAAMLSALMVVADQLISTWADGHLMVAWLALWLVGFATVAFLGGAARKLTVAAVSALDAWSQRVAKARADERLWALANTDPRVMADLRAAMTRSGS